MNVLFDEVNISVETKLESLRERTIPHSLILCSPIVVMGIFSNDYIPSQNGENTSINIFLSREQISN
jgi:hypothetical protein